MDDTCAVCAESLEWVAYGACGHKDVCSTCVARLRFICNDHRCCICKTHSSIVFVTKALGGYTKIVHDFTVFPAVDKEGRSGPYWYHEDTQSYFDDVEQYKMINAMCRLTCSVCDKVEENAGNGSKRRARFRDINQLKGHLFHQHKLLMCSLCLEGRKVFICEQKLYNKEQLKQHRNRGDTEVDGSESERGGFHGHPSCEFCRTSFYGDYELYTHMSTEHFTCHICHRQNPGQFVYYKNYEHLEIHFRQEHHLCEDEACLSKKFVVFNYEVELKKHNALEHQGRMSRSKRNAAGQVPTAFTYPQRNEQNDRRGTRHASQHDVAEYEHSQPIEASFETVNFNTGSPESMDGFEPLLQSSATMGTVSDSRYLTAVSNSFRNAPLEDSSFPPLSTGPSGSAPKPDGPPRNTMANTLRRQRTIEINASTAVSHSPRNAPPEESSFPSLSRGPSGSAPKPDGPPRNTMADTLRRLHTIEINARTAVLHSPRNAPPEESSFPSLSTGPSGSAPKPDGPPRNTMADTLRQLPTIENNVLNVGQAWPAASRFGRTDSHQARFPDLQIPHHWMYTKANIKH